MRKPLVSPMLWLATVTVQTFLVALVVGPLLTPVYISATVLKLNGTTSDANFSSVTVPPTTIASFLQDFFEETTLSPQLSNQVEELTTTIPSLEPSASHELRSTAIANSSLTEHDSPSSSVDGKPQKNGSPEEDEIASSTEQSEDVDNALPTTTDREDDTKAGVDDDSAGAGSTLFSDRDQDASVSLDKDESDTYFSAGDAPEGDSVSAASGGEEGGDDTIFPPDELDTDESVAPTTYASLLRPNPTINPQTFSSQLNKKLGGSSGFGGARLSNGRIGTRGLNSKSELNTIPSPTSTSFDISSIKKNDTNSDSISSSSEVTIVKDKVSDKDSSNYNSSRGVIDSTFYSRSNAHVFHPQQQQQQLLRARPTTSVINYSSNNNNNRIVKRKKLPSTGRSNTTGSSLSSIYGNSLLTSSTLSSYSDADETADATTANSADSLLSTPVESTTVSNSLLNPSHDGNGDDGRSISSSSNNSTETAQHERAEHEQHHQGSPSFTSGGGGSSSSNHSNLTTPVTPSTFAYISGSSNNNVSISSNATVSSSRAILGFGTSSSTSHGKVKRPKPIIIRDHEESLYVNNISENAGTTENGAISQSALGEETATLPVSGAGEEDGGNKPVSNALPTTPPFKVRRVKLTSRRISTSRPVTNADEVVPTTPIFSVSLASSNDAMASPSLTAAAASGATDYRHMSNIRPSVSSAYHHPPLFSSRRVFKEEFGITRNSYGGDDGDNNDDGDDSELQATTEFFSLENPTPYPMGVRAISAESDDNDEKTRIHEKKDADNQDGSRYRDYYSDARSPSVELGNANNLHIKSDSHDRESSSPVTVTVTHTVVQSTPQITPTATMPATEASLRNRMKGISNSDGSRANDQHGDRPGVENDAEKGNHPNLHPTPALPPSIFVSSTAILSSEPGQGPIISHSVEDVQVTTTRYGVTSVGIQSTQYDDHDDDHDSSHKGNDQVQNHKSEGNEDGGAVAPQQENLNTPVMPDKIHPTPTISQKNIKSVYFTQVEHPHFTSSSYEFSTSSMYSYYYPDHEPHHPDMTNHDHDHHDEHEDTTHYHPHPGGGENSGPTASSQQPDYENHPDTYLNGNPNKTTTISDGNSITASPTPPQFWDHLGMTSVTLNLTKSSSSQVPITMDQENGGVPTPTIDIDIYPPPGIGPNSKVEDATTPVTTGRPATTEEVTTIKANSNSPNRVPGSVEENEISEEELRKQQENAIPKTTMKPGVDGVTNGKGKGEENPSSGAGGSDSSGSSEDNDNALPNNVSGEGGVELNDGKTSDSSGAKKDFGNKDVPLEIKTPFGVGESFGIGTVHVPMMVQVVLDVAQPVFCSHVNSFKAMIVTVYGTEKRNEQVDPEQIVIYTEPSCDSKGNSDNNTKSSTGATSATLPVTGKPTTSPSKVITTSKGTYPLTSPPGTDDEGNRKARYDKTFAPLKNNGTTSSSNSESSSVGGGPKRMNDSSLSSTRNKNISDLDSTTNKSASVLSTEISAHQNKSLEAALIRSRRSTKMATAAAATKNTNISEDIKANPGSNSSSGDAENLLSVYFYVNNKNGSYDKNLTSSFIRLWNDSSRLTNVSGSQNGDGEVGGNDGSSNNINSNEMFIRRVKKVGMISASHLIQAQEPADENSGIIVAITVAAIVAVCLFLLGVGLLVMRHRQSQTKFAKRCTPVTLDDYSLDNISVYNSFRRKQRLRGSKRSYTNAAFDDSNTPSRPVNAPAVASALSDITSLENEFRAIPNISPTLDDIPQGAETKNRYANVIPMPDTRVLLTFQEDVPNSDYMNANYVRGVNGEPKRYIVTQGPLDDTIVDFWRMVWEQQIRVIFALTDFAEGGIAKCAEYYPRSETIDCSQLHGDYQITLEKRDISDNCITSYLVLKDMERNLRRDVVHFWYHSWPEKGVPASPKMTIDFLNRSRKFTKEPTPVLVHCSPGTGRSGAIVACDIAMKEYDTQNKVDIPRLVNKIRQDRAGAVQTKEQYVHIYGVLHAHASRIGAAHLESI